MIGNGILTEDNEFYEVNYFMFLARFHFFGYTMDYILENECL